MHTIHTNKLTNDYILAKKYNIPNETPPHFELGKIFQLCLSRSKFPVNKLQVNNHNITLHHSII